MQVLREKIRPCDAVLIATPEYDYAIPGIPLSQIDRRLVVEFVGVVWERFMDHLLGREPPVPFSIYVYCWY